MARVTVIKGRGNVFRDLVFSQEKSAGLMLKSCLLQAVQETIRSRGWKQVEAAVQLGIDQAKVSKLLAGQMAGFSIERFVHLLSLLGQMSERQFLHLRRDEQPSGICAIVTDRRSPGRGRRGRRRGLAS